MQLSANHEITQSLKLALKSRGLTYKDVADRIQVSEQTIKRLFKDKDCSLSRLNEVCEAIDLSIYDLLEFSKHLSEPMADLTDEQIEFLSNRPGHFSFLFFLICEYDDAQIQHAYGLTDLSVFKYLRDLDKYSFIELRENNKYRILIEGKLLLRANGPFKKMMKHFNSLFLDHAIEHDGKNNTAFNSSFRYMTESSLKSLNQELIDIHNKYRKLAYQSEMILPKDKMIPVKFSTLAGPFEILGRWPLDEHEEARN